MKGMRDTCFIVSLVVLASFVGHFAIQKHFERRVRNAISLQTDQLTARAVPRFMPEADISDIGKMGLPQFLTHSQPSGNIIPAHESQEEDLAVRPGVPPTAVPAPADAAPAKNPSSDEQFARDVNSSAVRDVIEDELSHATPEERDIWFDEFKTLPPVVVRELLQVRKQIRALPRLLGGMPEQLASTDTTTAPRSHELAAEPASQKIQFNLPDQYPATAALEKAISQLRHNLTNAATPGFKRLRVSLVDTYGPGWQESPAHENGQSESSMAHSFQGEGCRNAPLILDLKQGSLKKTDRQLDFAIDGEGFFVVRQDDKDYLTRCGAFTLDRDRQLCLAIINDAAVLQPTIKIPEEAREIQISAKGVVSILKSEEPTFVVIGQLQLGRVASPCRLQPVGTTLLLPNEASGAVTFGEPQTNGLGELQQGCVEQSNVEFAKELDEIDELTMILKSLPMHNSRPATARNLQQSAPR